MESPYESRWQKLYSSSAMRQNTYENNKKNNSEQFSDCSLNQNRDHIPLTDATSYASLQGKRIENYYFKNTYQNELKTWFETVQAKADEKALRDVGLTNAMNIEDTIDESLQHFKGRENLSNFVDNTSAMLQHGKENYCFANITSASSCSTNDHVSAILNEFSNKLEKSWFNSSIDSSTIKNRTRILTQSRANMNKSNVFRHDASHLNKSKSTEKFRKSKKKIGNEKELNTMHNQNINIESGLTFLECERKIATDSKNASSLSKKFNQSSFADCKDQLSKNTGNDSEGENDVRCQKGTHILRIPMTTIKPNQSAPLHLQWETRTAVRSAQVRDLEKVADNFCKKKLIEKYFSLITQYVAIESQRCKNIEAHVSGKKMHWLKRKVFRSWKQYVLEWIQKEWTISHTYELRLLRMIFSKWMDFTSKTALLFQKITLNRHWKMKAFTLSQWKRFVRNAKLERERIAESKRKLEEANLQSKACNWHTQRTLAYCFLGWKTIARVERNKRLEVERRENHKNRIEALMSRISKERDLKALEGEPFGQIKDKFYKSDSSKVSSDKYINDVMSISESKDMYLLRATPYESGIMDQTIHDETFVGQDSIKQQSTDIKNRPEINRQLQKNFPDKMSRIMREKKSNDHGSQKESEAMTCTQQMSNQRPINSFHKPVISNMEMRRLERSRRRKALQEHYIQIQREKEENAKLELLRKEKESRNQFDMERKKRQKEVEEQQKKIEERKKKWRSAKDHFERSLVRSVYRQWLKLIDISKLKLEKAQSIYWKKVKKNIVAQWKFIVVKANRHREELEHMKLLVAENYHNKSLCATVWKTWDSFLLERQAIFNAISMRRLCYLGKRIFQQWKLTYEETQLRLWTQERRGRHFGRRLHLRWVMDRWKSEVEVLRGKRLLEDKVAEKWAQVRQWLE